MSRFFRSGSSSSSSASEDDESDQDDIDLSASQLIRRPHDAAHDDEAATTDTRVVRTTDQTSPVSGTGHRDLLLHALLEERCIRQATDDLGPTGSIDRIRQVAQQQYAALSSRLAAYGLVEAGYDTAAFSTHRQAARDGLDTLAGGRHRSQNVASDTAQLALDFNALQLFKPQLDVPQLPVICGPALPDLLRITESPTPFGPLSGHPFHSSRYHREFEEVCTLGRGGYGIVYQCKHRFDGLSYAVKKVPLSTSRLQKIRDEGQAEVDRLLLELTTLARLEHPNIVRYFGGWIEMATLTQQNAVYDDVNAGASERTFSYASHEQSTAWRVAEVNDDDFISFETSTSRVESVTETISTSDSGETLQRKSTKDTQATVSDAADTESIVGSASADYSTLSSFAHDTAPCLALHIQMGLYPLSLADFLSVNTVSDTTRRHCFHLEPSLRILSALVDGVTYLHSQGVVHRDLKPANVFLAHSTTQQQTWCRKCFRSGQVTNGVKVRIGDFGLVAALEAQGAQDPLSPVGTELYRPGNAVDRHRLEAVDWFALGIIAFELLSPFATRMERHDALTGLRNGVYPASFTTQLQDDTKDVVTLMEYLLRNDQAVDAHTLQGMIDFMLRKC